MPKLPKYFTKIIDVDCTIDYLIEQLNEFKKEYPKYDLGISVESEQTQRYDENYYPVVYLTGNLKENI